MNKEIVIIGLVIGLIILITGCGSLYNSDSGDIEVSVYDGNIPIGTFKARIGNEIVFTNGLDIMDVDPDLESGVMDDFCQLDDKTSEYFCLFRLGIIISDEAAKRQASITSKLEIIEEDGLEYLSENLIIYLNDEKLDEVKISSDLKGKFHKEIQIMGSGSGTSKEEAIKDAEQQFDKLFDVLADVPLE